MARPPLLYQQPVGLRRGPARVPGLARDGPTVSVVQRGEKQGEGHNVEGQARWRL